MEHGLCGWNRWIRIFLIRQAKRDEHRFVCAIIFSYFNCSLPRLCHLDGRRHLINQWGNLAMCQFGNSAMGQWNANDSSPPPNNYRDSPMRKGQDSIENLLKRAILNTELVKPAFKKRCLLRHLSTLLMLIILLQPIYWHYGIKTHDKHVFWQNEPAILHWSFWYRSLWVLQNIQIYFHPKNECLTRHLHNKIP